MRDVALQRKKRERGVTLSGRGRILVCDSLRQRGGNLIVGNFCFWFGLVLSISGFVWAGKSFQI
jgi:hypothetical protein